MASISLFAPTVNSYEPAFRYDETCYINFTLSKYNTLSQVCAVQATVMSLTSGQSVVNKNYTGTVDERTIYAQTGILLNLKPIVVDESKGIYKIPIQHDFIQGGNWASGGLYKIQIRLGGYTAGLCTATTAAEQNLWLSAPENASDFSEWSTVIITKATGISSLQVPILEPNNKILTSSSLDLYGTYNNTDLSETVYSYTVKLLSNNTVLESSDILYTNAYSDKNEIKYTFKTELEKNVNYQAYIDILTINKYSYQANYNFTANPDEESAVDICLKEIPALKAFEEDEGCIALQISSLGQEPVSFSGKLRIRRTDQYSNYKIWEDICQIECLDTIVVDQLPPHYDFTIVSGVRYKYGIQKVVESGSSISRSPLVSLANPIYREFNFSYLVGENMLQLKLPFDCNVSSFNTNIDDAVIKTIGSKYPFVIRGGESDYKTFSLSSKISFNMDDNHLFLAKNFLEGYSLNTYIDLRDFTYERAFRDKVVDFLKDGKVKIFKSPSEGNLLVRLTNIGLSPETALSRLIYNFNSTTTEIDEANLENYKKYKIMNELPTFIYSSSNLNNGAEVQPHTHTVSDHTPVPSTIQPEYIIDGGE